MITKPRQNFMGIKMKCAMRSTANLEGNDSIAEINGWIDRMIGKD